MIIINRWHDGRGSGHCVIVSEVKSKYTNNMFHYDNGQKVLHETHHSPLCRVTTTTILVVYSVYCHRRVDSWQSFVIFSSFLLLPFIFSALSLSHSLWLSVSPLLSGIRPLIFFLIYWYWYYITALFVRYIFLTFAIRICIRHSRARWLCIRDFHFVLSFDDHDGDDDDVNNYRTTTVNTVYV